MKGTYTQTNTLALYETEAFTKTKVRYRILDRTSIARKVNSKEQSQRGGGEEQKPQHFQRREKIVPFSRRAGKSKASPVLSEINYSKIRV